MSCEEAREMTKLWFGARVGEGFLARMMEQIAVDRTVDEAGGRRGERRRDNGMRQSKQTVERSDEKRMSGMRRERGQESRSRSRGELSEGSSSFLEGEHSRRWSEQRLAHGTDGDDGI